MNEGHFKDLLFELIPPPAQKNIAAGAAGAAATGKMSADLMLMGFPAAPARHGLGRALRVPRADARSGVPLPALRRPPLRRTDRLRRVWTHDRVVTTAPRAELSPLVPRQVLLCRVSSGAAPPPPQPKCDAMHLQGGGCRLPSCLVFRLSETSSWVADCP